MSNQQVTYRLVQNSDEDPHMVLKNIKKVIDELEFCHVSEFEALLKDVMPSALTATQEIFAKNTSLIQSNNDDVLVTIRANFQVAISLLDTLNGILQHVMKHGRVIFTFIPSVPVNIADILFFTFDHCKNSQKIYSFYYKSVGEILELFRKAQEIYTKYLNFLDTHLTIDFLNASHLVAYKRILDTILEISRTLSGVNMKSMADSWKGFIGLIQKTPTDCVVSVNLSSAIQILTEEINNNLLMLTEGKLLDSVKFNQNFKLTGFLVKVVLKLFETGLNLVDSHEDILKFWVTIFSWHDGFFRTNHFSDHILDCVSAIILLSSESTAPLMRDSKFLKFCVIHDRFSTSKKNFGFLILINILMKELPQLLKNEPKLKHEFQIISLIRLVFHLTRSCYVEYYCDYDSNFYDEFVTNVAVIILLFPNEFSEIEIMLTECIVGECIWTSLIATDVWCLVLKYSTENVGQVTLNNLMKKIEELGLGRFHETSVTIRLKILAQRILKGLSDAGRRNEVAKYNPTVQLFAWKILSCRSVPLSYRYYVEFLISDIFDKMDIIENENYSYSDILNLMELFGIVSYTKFNELEINITRLLPVVMHLWSFDMHDIDSSNGFLKYFLYKLIKITVAVSGEVSDEHFLLISTQLKVLVNDSANKILISDILHGLTKRNFNHFPEKHTLFLLISNIFKILLNDKKGIVVQLALERFSNMFSNNISYENVINKRSAVKANYNLKYFEHIQTFKDHQHQCCVLTNSYQPACKKMKIDDTDAIINNLKNNADKLLNVISKNSLKATQRCDVKTIIDKLEALL